MAPFFMGIKTGAQRQRGPVVTSCRPISAGRKNLTMEPLTRAIADRAKGAMLHCVVVAERRGADTTGRMVGFDAHIL